MKHCTVIGTCSIKHVIDRKLKTKNYWMVKNDVSQTLQFCVLLPLSDEPAALIIAYDIGELYDECHQNPKFYPNNINYHYEE